MNLISKFDPWRSKLCTCPPKLTFNPYTGCDHACVYCYASGYIKKFFSCRPKKDLIQRLEREAARLKGELISIANSSDPYPNLEAETGLMLKCLEILSRHDCKIQIVTKSSPVVRDVDFLKKVPSMVTLTITTDNDNVSRVLEPYAPSPSERIKTAETLVGKGIPVSVRVDPVIPFVNDNPETLIKTLASVGVRHVTSSTYKIKPDNWRRFSMAMAKTAEKLGTLYFEKGEKIGRATYLPKELRLELMKKVSTSARDCGVKFGTCREGLSRLNTGTCDGSWLIRRNRELQ